MRIVDRMMNKWTEKVMDAFDAGWLLPTLGVLVIVTGALVLAEVAERRAITAAGGIPSESGTTDELAGQVPELDVCPSKIKFNCPVKGTNVSVIKRGGDFDETAFLAQLGAAVGQDLSACSEFSGLANQEAADQSWPLRDVRTDVIRVEACGIEIGLGDFATAIEIYATDVDPLPTPGN